MIFNTVQSIWTHTYIEGLERQSEWKRDAKNEQPNWFENCYLWFVPVRFSTCFTNYRFNSPAIMEKLWSYGPFTILFYKIRLPFLYLNSFHAIFSHSSFENSISGNVFPWSPIKTKPSIYFSVVFHPYVAVDIDSFQYRIKINFPHLYEFIDTCES